MIDYSSHPISLLTEWKSSLSDDDVLHFSHYKYVPQSPFDQRVTIHISVKHVSIKWLCNEIKKLEPGWDLAWHSLVRTSKGYGRHVPMIDFSTQFMNARERELVYELLEKFIGARVRLYRSGRSFHGYATVLLSEKKWKEFMGRLLLLNMPNENAIVDSRWVGHRIIAGYTSLRWTANSEHYRQMPSMVPNSIGEQRKNVPMS